MKLELDLTVKENGEPSNWFDTGLRDYFLRKGYKPENFPLENVFRIEVRIQHDGSMEEFIRDYDIDGQYFSEIRYDKLFAVDKDCIYEEHIFSSSGLSWKYILTTIPDPEHHKCLRNKILESIVKNNEEQEAIQSRNLAWTQNVIRRAKKELGVS